MNPLNQGGFFGRILKSELLSPQEVRQFLPGIFQSGGHYLGDPFHNSVTYVGLAVE